MHQIGMKVGDWFRSILACCDQEDEEEVRPALQISGPSNFRREDINIPGLTPEQQRFIREKAIADAQKMWTHLQPLGPLSSSPSGHFASPGNPSPTTAMLPSYEDFVTPRSPPAPTSKPNRRVSSGTWGERVKAHSRKISNSLTKPLGNIPTGPGGGYHGLGESPSQKEEIRYEMRGLVDHPTSKTYVVPAGKTSGESFSMNGSDGW